MLTCFCYARVIVCSAFSAIVPKRHVDVAVELRFLRGGEPREMLLHSTVSSQCRDFTPLMSIDRQISLGLSNLFHLYSACNAAEPRRERMNNASMFLKRDTLSSRANFVILISSFARCETKYRQLRRSRSGGASHRKMSDAASGTVCQKRADSARTIWRSNRQSNSCLLHHTV